MKKIYLGAAYYPEMWRENELETDIARCKKLSINCLRVGEFAWGKMEPKEDEFEFEWLIRVVEHFYSHVYSHGNASALAAQSISRNSYDDARLNPCGCFFPLSYL